MYPSFSDCVPISRRDNGTPPPCSFVVAVDGMPNGRLGMWQRATGGEERTDSQRPVSESTQCADKKTENVKPGRRSRVLLPFPVA